MKTFLTRIVPLLLCIVAGVFVSWLSIYAFWFAIWRFHSVPLARGCAAVGTVVLLPARYFSEWMGGDQTTVFSDPASYAATNGLILGVVFYSLFRVIFRHRVNGKSVVNGVERKEVKVG